jgi:hypothetical protein
MISRNPDDHHTPIRLNANPKLRSGGRERISALSFSRQQKRGKAAPRRQGARALARFSVGTDVSVERFCAS